VGLQFFSKLFELFTVNHLTKDRKYHPLLNTMYISFAWYAWDHGLHTGQLSELEVVGAQINSRPAILCYTFRAYSYN
jgi:hypothetical protein